MTKKRPPSLGNVVPFPGGLHAGWPVLERMIREAMNGYPLDASARQDIVDRLKAFYTETLQVRFELPINIPVPGKLTHEQREAIRLGMREQIVKPLEDAVDLWSRTILAPRATNSSRTNLSDPHPRAA